MLLSSHEKTSNGNAACCVCFLEGASLAGHHPSRRHPAPSALKGSRWRLGHLAHGTSVRRARCPPSTYNPRPRSQEGTTMVRPLVAAEASHDRHQQERHRAAEIAGRYPGWTVWASRDSKTCVATRTGDAKDPGDRRRLPEPVKETRLDRTRPTTGTPTPAGRRAPQARRATRRAKRARNPRPGNPARTTPPPRASNRPGPRQPRRRPAPARPPRPRTPHPWHATPPAARNAQPLPQSPARTQARTGHPKTQATQGKPASGVRPQSGTPARKTGHKYPYRHQTGIRQRVTRFSNNHRNVPVRPVSRHCAGFPEPLD